MENKLSEQEKFGLVIGELKTALENIKVIIEKHVINDESITHERGFFDSFTQQPVLDNTQNETTSITRLELADLMKQLETLKIVNKKQEKKINRLEKKNTTILEQAEHERLDSLNELSIKRLNEYVEELLQNENINIKYLPDFAERQIYRNTFSILFKLFNKLFDTTSIKFMGHKMKLDIEPLKDSDMDEPEFF